MRRLNQLSAQRAQTAARIATVEERTPRFLGAAGAGVEPAPDKFAAAHTPQETISLERPIAATDTRIDRLVHDLYGLTENEIRIVEGTI
jgi:hypothetical protein